MLSTLEPSLDLIASENTNVYASRHKRILNIIKTQILIYRKYYRPRSHRVEVAACGDPRANGDSTLIFARRVSPRLRIADPYHSAAHEPTHDRSLFGLAIKRFHYRAREHHACARRHRREYSSYSTRIRV
ncbi:hypothetical protein V1477_013638 [Vespula maculifrons]|uniref:Uncharacterized protein n=1 Tax=Vespula maculifrons TaxID=7453 RepID=A0ABD2BQR7_VESMC